MDRTAREQGMWALTLPLPMEMIGPRAILASHGWPVIACGNLPSIRKQARRADRRYSLLFMAGDGGQLAELTSLIKSSVIRPVLDPASPFEQTSEALAHTEQGRARGKVVITLR